jgi:superfamily II DNA helicase RecQ
LWELSPTFCAFVQRAGRAGRDFETLGGAILIVPKSVLKEGVSNENVNSGVSDAIIDAEALNREPEEAELTQTVVGVLDEEGIRVADDSDSTDEESISKVKRTKKFGKDTNVREARALSEFVTTNDCRRKVWDDFFENGKKCNY